LLNEQKYMDMCADVNFIENQNSSPLHYAVEAQNLALVQILISKYAELNARNLRGQTALHLASAYGNLDIVKELTKYTVEIFIDIQDEEGNTPLHLAALKG
jgi:ankyrin repeat protein